MSSRCDYCQEPADTERLGVALAEALCLTPSTRVCAACMDRLVKRAKVVSAIEDPDEPPMATIFDDQRTSWR